MKPAFYTTFHTMLAEKGITEFLPHSAICPTKCKQKFYLQRKKDANASFFDRLRFAGGSKIWSRIFRLSPEAVSYTASSDRREKKKDAKASFFGYAQILDPYLNCRFRICTLLPIPS